MRDDFHPRPAAYVFEEMADHIAARIAAGELRPDARLPAERHLATEYGVALGTARRALAVLRERGLVVTLPIKGTFVAEPANAAALDSYRRWDAAATPEERAALDALAAQDDHDRPTG